MGNGVVKSKDSKNPRIGEVTERQMRMAMRRQRKSGKVFCQGCCGGAGSGRRAFGYRIREDEEKYGMVFPHRMFKQCLEMQNTV